MTPFIDRRLGPLAPAEMRELAAAVTRSQAEALGRRALTRPLPEDVWNQLEDSPR